MYATHKILAAVIATVVALAATGTTQAQSLSHIDRTAQQLQAEVRVAHQEVHEHFRPTPGYADLDRALTAMEQRAAHIHEMIDRGGTVQHIRPDVQDLDRLVHQVEGLVDTLGRFREIDRRAYAHLRQSLDRVSGTVHHLMDDLAGPHGGHVHPY